MVLVLVIRYSGIQYWGVLLYEHGSGLLQLLLKVDELELFVVVPCLQVHQPQVQVIQLTLQQGILLLQALDDLQATRVSKEKQEEAISN